MTLAEHTDPRGVRWRLIEDDDGHVVLARMTPPTRGWIHVADVCDDAGSLHPDAHGALPRIVRRITGNRR